MREVERIRSALVATVAGDPWYGPAVFATLAGIDASAAARPIPGAHSIWEVVLHMTTWTKETTRRLRGGPHGTPAEGDWPAVAATDPAAWNSALADLRAAHDELAGALLEAADEDLDRQVAGAQVDSQGRPVTRRQTVMGLLQHDAYHAGQIAILKKLLGSQSERAR